MTKSEAQRRTLVQRALRAALYEWADGRNLLDSSNAKVGYVEVRGSPGAPWVEVILPDYNAVGFRIEVI